MTDKMMMVIDDGDDDRSMMMMRRRRRHQKKRPTAVVTRVCLEDGVSSVVLRSRLQKVLKEHDAETIDELVVTRKQLDSMLLSVLEGFIITQQYKKKKWKLVEIHGHYRSKWQLLQYFLNSQLEIDHLILQSPSEAMIQWIGNNNNNDSSSSSCCNISSLTLRSTTLSLTCVQDFSNGLMVGSQNNNNNNINNNDSKKLQRLEMSRVDFTSLEAIRTLGVGLQHHGGLKEFSLYRCGLEDEELGTLLPYLEHHPQLEKLELGGNFCQAQGMQAVARVIVKTTSLKVLDLSDQDIWDNRTYFHFLTAALVAKRRGNINNNNNNPRMVLDCLNLSSNFLMDEQLELLVKALVAGKNSSCCLLRRLTLQDNSFTNAGLATLGKGLPHMRGLEMLDLRHNNAYDQEGIHYLEMGVQSNTSLLDLLVDNPTPMLHYWLALNRGGRVCKLANNRVPLSLWSLILARTAHCLTSQQKSAGITQADVIFDLVHGPVLLDR